MRRRVKRHSKFDDLMLAIGVYDREAERCEKAGAFVAGCILQGALLEAILTAMGLVYRESVWKTTRYKRVKARVWKKFHRSVVG